MPWIAVDGERKKVACGPCIRGHRSSKCDHRDRILLEVRKPGRPLSGCPHPAGSCSCERIVINYTIPKSSGGAGTCAENNRVQKPRQKKTNANKAKTLIAVESPNNPAAPEEEALSAATSTVPNSEDASTNPSSPPSSESALVEVEANQQFVVEVDTNQQPAVEGVENVKVEGDTLHPLQLGMMGAGGYGTSQDDVGWTGNWPDDTPFPGHCTPRPDGPIEPKNCCGTSKKLAQERILEQPERKSCCKPATETYLPAVAATVADGVNGLKSADQHRHFATNNTYVTPDGNFEYREPIQEYTPHRQPSNGYRMNENVPMGNTMGAPLATNFHPFTVPNNTWALPPAPEDVMSHGPGNCDCGDECACLGCATHPKNITTTSYVRDMGVYMMQNPGLLSRRASFQQQYAQNGVYNIGNPQQVGPTFGPPFTQQHYNGNSTQYLNEYAATYAENMPYPHQQQMMYQPIPHPTFDLNHLQLQSPSTDQDQDPRKMFLKPYVDKDNSSMRADFASQLERVPQIDTVGYMDFEHLINSPEEDTNLSPTSYLFQAVELPACNDANGICQCGEECNCADCRVHGGPTLPANNDFNFDFMVNANVNVNGNTVVDHESRMPTNGLSNNAFEMSFNASVPG